MYCPRITPCGWHVQQPSNTGVPATIYDAFRCQYIKIVLNIDKAIHSLPFLFIIQLKTVLKISIVKAFHRSDYLKISFENINSCNINYVDIQGVFKNCSPWISAIYFLNIPFITFWSAFHFLNRTHLFLKKFEKFFLF